MSVQLNTKNVKTRSISILSLFPNIHLPSLKIPPPTRSKIQDACRRAQVPPSEKWDNWHDKAENTE